MFETAVANLCALVEGGQQCLPEATPRFRRASIVFTCFFVAFQASRELKLMRGAQMSRPLLSATLVSVVCAASHPTRFLWRAPAVHTMTTLSYIWDRDHQDDFRGQNGDHCTSRPSPPCARSYQVYDYLLQTTEGQQFRCRRN